jgi:hypothetical protein
VNGVAPPTTLIEIAPPLAASHFIVFVIAALGVIEGHVEPTVTLLAALKHPLASLAITL